MNRKTALLVIAAVLLVAALSGCEYLQKGSAAIVDGAAYYCETNTEAGREVIRDELRGELQSEHLEVCLGCAGDGETVCVGEHRPKVDDTD